MKYNYLLKKTKYVKYGKIPHEEVKYGESMNFIRYEVNHAIWKYEDHKVWSWSSLHRAQKAVKNSRVHRIRNFVQNFTTYDF